MEKETKRLIQNLKSALINNAPSFEIENIKESITSIWKREYTKYKTRQPMEDDITILQSKYNHSEDTVLYLITHYFLDNNININTLFAELKERNYNCQMLEDLKRKHELYKKICCGINKGDYNNLDVFIKENKLEDSELAFCHNVLQYLKGLDDRTSSIAFCAKKLFSFKEKYMQEVRTLLVLLVYGKNESVENRYLGRCLDLFKKEYCKATQFPWRNVIYDLFEIGSISLTPLIKGSELYTANDINDENEIPVELPIKSEHKYHSLFICPVLKTVCGEDNPPILLSCGHVISYIAVMKLSRNGTMPRHKCPYCPQECTKEENVCIKL
ncbi:LisH domain-containing protein C29A3.03c [Astathelohania contejeani]|uniref:LisH domain-containing protein C29A3.03c n=1 Tax=Astathelohania contejeani TaxID=164912 RepID=A0ABQ7HWW0_9MICR|nr:LisH domain-containing protein C29A3.03c [Thelohania contejeani]